MKLLLVEDDREIQEMLGDYLRTEAYEVVCASTGGMHAGCSTRAGSVWCCWI